jgi:N-acetyl-gamma-glutamyl-phosphate reductase
MGDVGRVPVGIVGASGYGGVQLVRLLQDHPNLELVYLGGDSSAGKDYVNVYPHLFGAVNLKIEPIDVNVIAERCRVVFLGLPNALACDMAPQLLERGCKVLDLSADYRLKDMAIYKQFYSSDLKGKVRSDTEALEASVYGLPELYREQLREASLVGCPGCYPTASLLALAPLFKQGLIEPDTAIIDAKSGTSGGGRQGKIGMLLAEADNAIAPYGLVRHRHTPEIEQICSDLSGREVQVQFTPHLVPMVRGILATVYAKLRDPGLVRDDLFTIYNAFYRNNPWVKVLAPGTYPATKWAYGTNLCFISVEVDPRTDRVIVMSVIDNLMKGQASQAVQCLNIMMGWDETLGLPKVAFYP